MYLLTWSWKSVFLIFTLIPYRGFPTRMVYLYFISCFRYTILVGNPWYLSDISCCSVRHEVLVTIVGSCPQMSRSCDFFSESVEKVDSGWGSQDVEVQLVFSVSAIDNIVALWNAHYIPYSVTQLLHGCRLLKKKKKKVQLTVCCDTSLSHSDADQWCVHPTVSDLLQPQWCRPVVCACSCEWSFAATVMQTSGVCIQLWVIF